MRIDVAGLRKTVLQQTGNIVGRKSLGLAREYFQKYKNEFFKGYDESEVVRELSQGPRAENITDSLGGYGNLYSFLGFNKGEQPEQELREFLEHAIHFVSDIARKIEKGDKISFRFGVAIPAKGELKRRTPLPWDGYTDLSWLDKVENGVDNFMYYLYDKRKEWGNSRSGPAYQVKNVLRTGGNFKPQPFLIKLLEEFKAKFA